MPAGNAQNYQGTGHPDVIDDGVDLWLMVYNETASAYTNGAIKNIVVGTDASGVPYLRAIAPATSAVVANTIGVVDNSPLGLNTIAAYAYGYVKVRGKVLALVDPTPTTQAIGDPLEVIASGVSFIVDAGGVNDGLHAVTTAAIALETYDTHTSAIKSVFLLGKLSSIAAT